MRRGACSGRGHFGRALAILGDVLDEVNMPPGDRREVAGIVITGPAQTQIISGKCVPFLAGDLAGLAADAQCRVGKETEAAAGLDPVAGGQLGLVWNDPGQKGLGVVEGARIDRHRIASRRPRRRFQVNALPSWIEVLGSPTTALRILAMSPGQNSPEMPDQPDFVDRLAIEPERPHSLGHHCFDFDLAAQSRDSNPVQLQIPSNSASSEEISANASGCNSALTGTERVGMPPA